jgi:hypothetical protein
MRIICSVLAFLVFYSLYLYFRRMEQLRLKTGALPEAMATLGSGSAVPVEINDEEPTERIAYEESRLLAAQGELAETDNGSAVPLAITDQQPTCRISYEESRRLAASAEIDELLVGIESRFDMRQPSKLARVGR